LHLDYTKVIILILWWRNFQLEYWRTFQLVSTNIDGEQDIKGDNPFKLFCVDKTFNYIVEHKHPADSNEINLSEICKTYDPPYKISTNVYDYIKEHLNDWVEEAIRIRNQYPK
jgi:hypothetical protein